MAETAEVAVSEVVAEDNDIGSVCLGRREASEDCCRDEGRHEGNRSRCRESAPRPARHTDLSRPIRLLNGVEGGFRVEFSGSGIESVASDDRIVRHVDFLAQSVLFGPRRR